jgi:aminopeptidase YwaD
LRSLELQMLGFSGQGDRRGGGRAVKLTRGVLAALALAFAFVLSGDARQNASTPDPGARVHARVDPAIDAMWAAFDRPAAMEHVRFISQFWRLPGNPGYNATVDRIQARLKAAGITTSIDEYPNSGPAWDHTTGTLALISSGAKDEVVLSRDRERLALCINSFSTPPGGIVANLVDVGAGRDADWAGKELKGAVVLGDGSIGSLWQRAVINGGAAGVISTTLPAYLSVDPPGAKPTPRDQWDILQWGSVPYNADRKAFGFKASPRAAATLRKRLAAAAGAAVQVRVTVESSFHTGPIRTLIGEIPGASAPDERVVLAAHIQEPGANDNASGVATLAEIAVAMASAIKAGKMPPPGRTITFLFLNEISGSRRWLQDHPDQAKQTKYMFSLDMTGEDVAKTGGSFLVERYPDPNAVWDRPWDPHSEWGKGNIRAESLKGDVINDAHLLVAHRVARKTNWVVRTNPYEGGSDHTVFGGAGIPSLLDWHFTDRYYHTNFDTPDKTSADEMRNVGVAAGASAWLLASTTEAAALEVAGVVSAAGRDRIALETREGGKLAAAEKDSTAAAAREATILAAWRKWYGEAVRSATRLVTGSPSASFTAELTKLAEPFDRPAPPGFALSYRSPLPSLQEPQVRKAYEPLDGMVVCGEDLNIPPIPLRWTTVVMAADGRLFTPCPNAQPKPHPPLHREVRELTVLVSAFRSRNFELSWRGIQAYGRLGEVLGGMLEPIVVGKSQTDVLATQNFDAPLGHLTKRAKVIPACNLEVQLTGVGGLRWQPGVVFQAMRRTNARDRSEAAIALGNLVSAGGYDAAIALMAAVELEKCVLLETDPGIRGSLLEALGRVRFGADAERKRAERFLVQHSRGVAPEMLGAARGLEVLIRLSPRKEVDAETTERLREMATLAATTVVVDETAARIRRLALMTLQLIRDTDTLVLERLQDDADWQVRRLVVQRIAGREEELTALIRRFEADQAFQVRYDLMTSISRLAARTLLCAPLVKFLDDPSPLVAMRAMDVLNPRCTDLEDGIKKLEELSTSLERSTDDDWHLPSRAATALSRLNPDIGAKYLPIAEKHSVWQVRAAAAAAAAQMNDGEALVRLANDPMPNVRTAAIEAMVRIKHAGVYDAALAALDSEDYQLLRAAAIALRFLPEARREDASNKLLATLHRVTAGAEDTSRDPRLAMLERLAEVLPPTRASDLHAFVNDWDPEVSAAAIKAHEALGVGTPAVTSIRRRYPFIPSEDEIATVPKRAEIHLKDGIVTIELLPEVATVTIARFARLARQGYYNGLTFHRIVPNFVVQGGSPGANEYVGARRFMRDELGGAHHVRGAVGISTRGRDTGDAQIFIDLVDLPRLDRDYTVFGYVTSGMELVDKMLDGAVIKGIVVR